MFYCIQVLKGNIKIYLMFYFLFSIILIERKLYESKKENCNCDTSRNLSPIN